MLNIIDSSTIKYGTEPNQIRTVREENRIDMINKGAKGRSFANKYFEDDDGDSKEEKGTEDSSNEDVDKKGNNGSRSKYVGKREDDSWWSKVEPKLKDESKQTDASIYEILVGNMGIFRWQNPQYVNLTMYFIHKL